MLKNLYGKIVDGELKTSDVLLDGYKPVVYADILEFDQEKQYIIQSEPVDRGDDIYFGVEIKTIVQDDDSGTMMLGL
jgi:hypothetical protein